MADGEHEIGPDEDVDLAELDLLGLVEVARRAQHDEQGVVVAFELGPLVGDDGVLDGEGVEAELRGERRDFVLVGTVQADPGHAVGLLAEGARRSRPAMPGDATRSPST